MDVTFFEDMSYFSSSDTALQGENSYFEELYHGEGEESEGGEEEVTQAGGILTDPVETISSPPLEAVAPNIQAPVSMAENEVEDTTAPPAIASTPDPQLPGTEDHSFEWRKAMEEEMEALQKNNTWQLVPPSQGKKAVVTIYLATCASTCLVPQTVTSCLLDRLQRQLASEFEMKDLDCK
ncbi:uncharacterized protein LOC133711831 [Rosa rugosa]|uniref:uncharacterized protein LOC133711831 n=1 Tax=Rosa rugosa TaxID=74645 RepID=UPI002B4107FC|nr:uncharacterized protein LOC133711831 [Rosa rugosa]